MQISDKHALEVEILLSEENALGIDASNIRAGGVIHLVKLPCLEKPQTHGFEKVIGWSGLAMLNPSKDRP